jgi:hypothetical protein
MRNAFAAALVVAIAGHGVAAAAAAQFPGMPGMPKRHLVRFGFGGGMSVPTRNAGDALNTGVNGQAYLLIDTGVLPPLRFNLGYQRFKFSDALAGPTAEHSNILSGVGGFSMNLIRLGPVRTYITAGLGAFNISASGGGSSSTKFGIDGGAGLAIKLGRLEGFVEGRVQNVYTDTGFINEKNIQSIPVTFGILF